MRACGSRSIRLLRKKQAAQEAAKLEHQQHEVEAVEPEPVAEPEPAPVARKKKAKKKVSKKKSRRSAR